MIDSFLFSILCIKDTSTWDKLILDWYDGYVCVVFYSFKEKRVFVCRLVFFDPNTSTKVYQLTKLISNNLVLEQVATVINDEQRTTSLLEKSIETELKKSKPFYLVKTINDNIDQKKELVTPIKYSPSSLKEAVHLSETEKGMKYFDELLN